MSSLRQRFIEELMLRGRSASTIDCYVRAIRRLSEFYGKSLRVLTDVEIRSYLLHMRTKPVAIAT